ncbi:THAP domain-containing 6-like isoform X1 [Labeo rohita]|uniref:THAP domain-containing 6-like isoform X1 n=1 Tax=Labeo rohita TaxID=84645 RepID=A0A498M5H9_LABRO|nr:THAP domain-containing 6-like isoform X1 [Labeo rohita]RXN33020.1 THAP domain-containing 6-like isoform X1 [Labeo rohita]
MPDYCAAYGCSNERNEKTKQQGITFHRFPSDKQRRQSWAIALRREGFEPKDRTVLCSCHFRPEDFDKTGQTVRLRQGAIPSIFKFPDHLSKPSSSRLSRTSHKATEESPQPWSNMPVMGFVGQDLFHESISDHQYALEPVKPKEKLAVYQENMEKLRRDLRNAKDRERRQKKTVSSLLEDLKKNKMLTEKLEQKLDFYSDLPVELFKHDHAFTPTQREFALTLHLHGPKAYTYLRETMKIPLPHPHTLLKLLQTVDAKPGLNTSLLDMLQRQKNKDPARYLSVTGFVININSFTMMIPELLEGQRYVCTYRFSQDHLELFFQSISIRASGRS